MPAVRRRRVPGVLRRACSHPSYIMFSPPTFMVGSAGNTMTTVLSDMRKPTWTPGRPAGRDPRSRCPGAWGACRWTRLGRGPRWMLDRRGRTDMPPRRPVTSFTDPTALAERRRSMLPGVRGAESGRRPPPGRSPGAPSRRQAPGVRAAAVRSRTPRVRPRDGDPRIEDGPQGRVRTPSDDPHLPRLAPTAARRAADVLYPWRHMAGPGRANGPRPAPTTHGRRRAGRVPPCVRGRSDAPSSECDRGPGTG